MAALSDTQLPLYFNGRYCRVCTTIVSPPYPRCPVRYRSLNSIVARGQESAVSVICSVPMLASRRCFIEIPHVWRRGKKSDGRTMIRRDGRADSRQAHRSLLSPRDDEEKKSQASWSNPTKPIVKRIAARYRLVFTTVSPALNLALNLA